jgi:hypothetical protein
MANTGVWVKAELDDEGRLSVRLFGAAALPPGINQAKELPETVHHNEDVHEFLDPATEEALRKALQSVIDQGGKAIMAQANGDASAMRAFFDRKPEKGLFRTMFGGKTDASGDLSKDPGKA